MRIVRSIVPARSRGHLTMSSHMSDQPSVDTLLEQCILALENGGASAADALLAAYPEHAATLRRRLDDLQTLGILQAPRAAPAIPERLGEFRLLRQIGRGGMGVVYLAEQSALQRDVALKLVHPQHLLFPGARERFRREVLAIARLQHPGIVPILTGGEAEGIPFYAMELVAGASLAEVLGELVGTALQALDGPLLCSALQRAMAKKQDDTPVDDATTFRGAWTKVACRLVLDAAEALQHAHEQGVLHRDLKPSNLLLTATGRVRLIDFGLAISAGEQRITRSGTTFGSLPYMAPEQVRGETQRCDARTDVYQLGVTLYELLALTLPHGDGSPGTRERILAGDVEPPSRKNPLAHADAEAVCLKAMDVDPARRYATAGELAADLRAFLDGRSVQARRPGPLLRVARWARRRPRLAAAAAFAFAAPLVFALQQRIANVEADRQRAIAEQNLEQALVAVDQMLLRTAEARLADVPRTAGLRRQLLKDAVGIHERLVESTGGEDPRLRLARARARARLGALQTELGALEDALVQLTRARGELAALQPLADHPDRVLAEIARCDDSLVNVYGRSDRQQELAAAVQRSLTAYGELVERTGEPRYVEAALRARLNQARCLTRAADASAAAAELDTIDRLLAEPDARVAALPALVRALLPVQVADQRGVMHAQNGDTEAAVAAFREALRRVEAAPADIANHDDVVMARLAELERLGLIHHQRREFDVAQPLLDRACAEYGQLVGKEPEYTSWRVRLARMLKTRATNNRHRGDTPACAADHDRAIELLGSVAKESPDDAEARRALAVAYAERASFHAERRDMDGAFADFERAEQELEACMQTVPGNRQAAANLGAMLCNHAIAKTRVRDWAAAKPLIDRALAINRGLTGAEALRSSIEMHGLASDVALHLEDEQGAQHHMAEAVQRVETMLEQRPDDASALGTAGYLAINHGTMLLSLDRHDEAMSVWKDALPRAEHAAAMSPFGRMVLGTLLLRMADLHVRKDRMPEARDAFAAALRAGATKAQVAPFHPLPLLFDRPEFADLLQNAGAAK